MTRRHKRQSWPVAIAAGAGLIVSLTGTASAAIVHTSPAKVTSAPARDVPKPSYRQNPSGPNCDDVKFTPGSKGIITCITSPDKLPAAAQAKRKAALKTQPKAAPSAIRCVKNKLVYNRTESCYFTEIASQWIDRRTRAVVGYDDIAVYASAKLDHRNRNIWTQHITAETLFEEGEATKGVMAFATAKCDTGCTATNSPDGELALGIPVVFDYTVSSPGRATAFFAVQPVFTAAALSPNVVSDPLVYDIGRPADVRCDSTKGISPVARGGCVYELYTPTYNIDTTDPDIGVDQVAWHIQWAQHNLIHHWGWRGHGPALTRTTDKKLIDLNRRMACRGAPDPRPTGKSCDEYPFASTYEGAAENSDYSCRMVPKTQNTDEGRDIRLPFYKDNRVLDGDLFWVHVILPSNGQTAPPPSVNPSVKGCP